MEKLLSLAGRSAEEDLKSPTDEDLERFSDTSAAIVYRLTVLRPIVTIHEFDGNEISNRRHSRKVCHVWGITISLPPHLTPSVLTLLASTLAIICATLTYSVHSVLPLPNPAKP